MRQIDARPVSGHGARVHATQGPLFCDFSPNNITHACENFIFSANGSSTKEEDGTDRLTDWLLADMMERLLTELQRKKVAPGEKQKKDSRDCGERERERRGTSWLAHILCPHSGHIVSRQYLRKEGTHNKIVHRLCVRQVNFF